jgi:hypothetical protein
MKTFDFYEFAGILVPGAVLLFGLVQLIPGLAAALGGKELVVGNLGPFVVLSYAAGHIVQALGTLIEPRLWALRWWGGALPTDRIWGDVKTGKGGVLSPPQIATLAAQLQPKLGLTTPLDPSTLNKSAWPGLTRQVYAAVAASNRASRVDIFNGTYGMMRGLACSLLILLAVIAGHILIALIPFVHSGVPGGTILRLAAIDVVLLLMVLLILYRMYRFGLYYGRELFVQFLQLPLHSADTTTPPTGTP